MEVREDVELLKSLFVEMNPLVEGFAGVLPELARYGRQDPLDNGPERIPERRAPRRASGRLAERIRAP